MEMPNIMLTIRSAAAALIILSLTSTGLLVVGLMNYFNYANPYSYVPSEPVSLIDTNISPVANHTLIFVLDGVRADIFYSTAKPNIDSFGGWANLTNVQCSALLSVSRAGYGVIPSGVNTSESQNIANENTGPFTADSLWKTTLRHNGSTAFVGSDTWHELFGAWMNYSITFSESVPGQATLVVNTTSGEDPIKQELPVYSDVLVSMYAIDLLNSHVPTFTVIHFTETDEIGHENGSLSKSYQDAVVREDTYVGQILSAYDALGILNSTLVIVTSDHGQTDFPGKGGEHGGIEPEVLQIPLLIRGPRIVPGVYSDSHHQNSIAPTVSAVMGWEIPYDASGNVLFESLDLSAQEEAVYRINQASLRLEQAEARVHVMGYNESLAPIIETANSQLLQAKSNFSIDAYNQARDAAIASEDTSILILQLSLYSKIHDEITLRLALILGLGGVICAIMILSEKAKQTLDDKLIPDKRRAIIIVTSASIYFLILPYAALLSGWQFSASYLAAYFDELLFRLFAIAFIPFMVAIGILYFLQSKIQKQEQTEFVNLSSGFVVSSSTFYLLGIALIIIFNGTGLPWYAQDAVIPLMYFFSLISTIAFSAYSSILLVIGHMYATRKRGET
jgi:hypothetical protein